MIASDDVTEHIFSCSLYMEKKNHSCTLRLLYGRRHLQVGTINRVHDAFVQWSHGNIFIRDKTSVQRKSAVVAESISVDKKCML